jgi:Domain of unknown function (DUF4149)
MCIIQLGTTHKHKEQRTKNKEPRTTNSPIADSCFLIILLESRGMPNKIKVSLLSLWLGVAVFFSAVVAPSVFGVLRQFEVANTGELAGAIVNRNLRIVNLSGFAIGLLVLAATLFSRSQRKLLFILQTLSLLVLIGGTSAGHWVVAARIHALRLAMVVPIDTVDIADPRRVAFNQLHGYSVALLTSAMLATILCVVLFMLPPKPDNHRDPH